MEASTTDQILPMVAHNLGIGFYPEALASEPIARGEVLPIRLVEPIPNVRSVSSGIQAARRASLPGRPDGISAEGCLSSRFYTV